MKTVEVFVVDDSNEIIQDNSYNVIKVIKDTSTTTTMLVFYNAGDISVVKAMKGYSTDPFRYIVRHKFLIPMLFDDEDD